MKDHNDKHKASSRPEYLMQQQLEAKLNQDYNKMLLALNFGLLKQINNQIQVNTSKTTV